MCTEDLITSYTPLPIPSIFPSFPHSLPSTHNLSNTSLLSSTTDFFRFQTLLSVSHSHTSCLLRSFLPSFLPYKLPSYDTGSQDVPTLVLSAFIPPDNPSLLYSQTSNFSHSQSDSRSHRLITSQSIQLQHHNLFNSQAIPLITSQPVSFPSSHRTASFPSSQPASFPPLLNSNPLCRSSLIVRERQGWKGRHTQEAYVGESEG